MNNNTDNIFTSSTTKSNTTSSEGLFLQGSGTGSSTRVSTSQYTRFTSDSNRIRVSNESTDPTNEK